MTGPAITLISAGLGVQTTAMMLLARDGLLPKPDACIFADTGNEPRPVMAHLERLREDMAAAGIPIITVSNGDLVSDALNTRRVQMPVYLKVPTDRGSGMIGRSCTMNYKLIPIKREIRRLLGYPGRAFIPQSVYAEQWIGISRDEFHRAKDAPVRYIRNVFPLLHAPLVGADGREGWTRADCHRYLASQGYEDTPKSACVICPFRDDQQWRDLRAASEQDWQDAVAFDDALRASTNHKLKGEPYLHRSLLPLRDVTLRVSTRQWRAAQTDIFEQIADEAPSCSPWSCDRAPAEGDAA